MTTVTAGLMLMLVSASCSSKANTRTTANPPPADRVVATDRSTTYPDDVASSDRMRTTDSRTASTERPVPSNRVGSGDNRIADDRVVPCADDKGDMTASADCVPRNRRMGNDATAYDPGARATCASRTDAKGHVIYDDPACAARYRTQMGSSFENVNWSRESAFFDRYMDKAVKHAREAEIAGNQGHGTEMLRHAELSLEQAKEAQRAGNVPGLNEGIIDLRETLRHGALEQSREAQRAGNVPGVNEGMFDSKETLRHGEGAQWPNATADVRDARIHLSQAAGMKARDTRPVGTLAATNSMASSRARMVKGELIGDEATTRGDGGRQYLLRDRDGKDTPILLTPDMTRNLKAGDVVEAQVDSDGRVVAINKYQ